MTEKNHTPVLRWDDTATLHKLQSSLNNDRVSIVSTDTILGFLARPTKSGYDQLNRLKGSREGKNYLLIISSPEKLKHFVNPEALDPHLVKFLNKCWPGPITIVFQAHESLPPFLCAPNKTIALRCPAHKGLQQLLPNYEGLISTSANLTEQPVWRSVDQIPPAILNGIDTVVVDPAAASANQPSTIIDASSPAENGKSPRIRVIREGSYPIAELEKMYGQPFDR